MLLNIVNRITLPHMIGAALVVGLTILHYHLSKKSAWAGAIVPAAYCGFIAWVVIQNGLPGGYNAFLMVLGLVLLGSYWGKAREVAKRELDEEDEAFYFRTSEPREMVDYSR